MSLSNDPENPQNVDYDRDCIICTESLPAVGTSGDRHVVKCTNGHHFCSNCIDAWAEENNGQRKCPLCRVARVPNGTDLTANQMQRIRINLRNGFKVESLEDVDIFMQFVQEHVLSRFYLPLYDSEISCIFYTNIILKRLDAPELPVPDPKDNPDAKIIDFGMQLSLKVAKKLRKCIEPCYE